ncbi:fimbrial protein [Yersinia enterocolitica]|uniref:fimbrial protein n=1 Tax=Yersinia enterocolitica TaxID=630 RepID=UPI0005E3BBD4|nr:fimbrial protein [Yersinia enterocolitica]CNK09961.1 putative fimbrial subunit [Yersinia enterocolitica]CNK09990.1 putative fimbrial subunit [Yersinia enterocolitica]
MNYLNIRPNTLPKKNRFIWLFFIAASLYSLLSATAHAAKCSDGGSTLPGDISLTFHPGKDVTSTAVVAIKKIKCEITENDDTFHVFFNAKINKFPLNKITERIALGVSRLDLYYAISSSATDHRCLRINNQNIQPYRCTIKNDTGLVINFEYTVKIEILIPYHTVVSKDVDIPVSISGYHSMSEMINESKVGDLNHSIKFNATPISCSLNTSNINFDLGKQKITDFTRIGSTNGWSDTKRIELSCPPDTKYFLQIDGIAEPNHRGVLKLSPEPGAASGVGVQLLTGKNNDPVVFGQPKQMGISASSGTNLPEKIDITARYYQIADKVTPGSANASATFTLTYQ